MSRQLWCSDCSAEKQAGTRMVYPQSEEGEPAEYERVMKGTALQPKDEQRFMLINGERHELNKSQFECDNCSKPILPGEQACTWTVWTEHQLEPAPWEQDFIRLQ